MAYIDTTKFSNLLKIAVFLSGKILYFPINYMLSQARVVDLKHEQQSLIYLSDLGVQVILS